MYDVIVSIIDKLNSNTELKALVSTINPFNVTGKNKMYYNYINLTSDGVKAQARLSLVAVCDRYTNSIKAIEEVKKTLLTIGDNKFNDDILSIALNGGGSMRDLETDTFHETAYFTIQYKERI